MYFIITVQEQFFHEFGDRHGPFWSPLYRHCIQVKLGVKIKQFSFNQNAEMYCLCREIDDKL